jgi:HK97 family phage prohead protease
MTAIATPELTRKALRFTTKALEVEERTFEGLLATWDEDLGGDVIHRGSFRESLKDIAARGEVIKLLDHHNSWRVRDALGKLLEAEERKEGLWTKWRIVRGMDGDAVLDRLRDGVIDRMSIGFYVLEAKDETNEGRITRHITKGTLAEGSLVIFPMNPGAAIDVATVKSFADLIATTDPATLGDEARPELRKLASRIGTLLRPAGSAAPADEQTQDPEHTPQPPETAVLEEKTETEPIYLYSEALQQRLLGLRIHQTLHGTARIQ